VLWGLFYFVVSDLSFVQCHPWARSNKHRTSSFELTPDHLLTYSSYLQTPCVSKPFLHRHHLQQSTRSIPGPIEVADEVLFANAHPSMSHVSQDFIPVFGDCIRMIRYVLSRSLLSAGLIFTSEVLFTKEAQPFLISGSGTLGWDQVSSTHLFSPGSIFTCEFRSPRTSLNREKMRLFSIPDILVTASLTGQPASSFSVYPVKITRTKPRDIWRISYPAQGSDRWYHSLRYPRCCTPRQALQSSHIHTRRHINRCPV